MLVFKKKQTTEHNYEFQQIIYSGSFWQPAGSEEDQTPLNLDPYCLS